jgi:hypothetical protein
MNNIYIIQIMTHSSHATIKAFSAGVFAGSLDAYFLSSKGVPLNSVTLPRCLTFGAIVGGSFLIADMIAPDMTNRGHSNNSTFFSAKTIEHRLIELSLGGGTALAANKFIFQASSSDLMKQAAIVAAANFLGEYVADYATSQPLSYFA